MIMLNTEMMKIQGGSNEALISIFLFFIIYK
jgi:hypothetical protein